MSLQLSDHSKIWQAPSPGQGAFKFSEQYKHFDTQYHSLET